MRKIPLKPHPVLDEVLTRFSIKNDRQLGLLLGFDCPYMSKLRNQRFGRTPNFALAIHEVFGLSFAELRQLGGANFVGVDAPVKYAGEDA